MNHQHEPTDTQLIDLTREIEIPGDVRFDPERLSLYGSYADQLSAYRAKRSWVETLESCFLLDQGHDFEISVYSNLEEGQFSLTCAFLTACARYAFWRLTNHQAPEAQYMIETAHIPASESHHEQIMSAPDLTSVLERRMDSRRVRTDSQDGNFVLHLREAIGRILGR